ncbi:ScbR family autoregulator-binding transcription factor [Streptomyces sp. NPDC052299]|uniref:ScbR family autoregulator-binding transcription factor n=1 Tax=Streptomyces sp. NPDC052299 TaxID=3155054 RepID=UPI003436EB84
MQERSERTRRRLVDAAAELFTRSGYASATLGQIAAAAGVTKGALYFHFPSKEALADAVALHGRTLLREFLDERHATGDGPVQHLIDLTHWLTLARREDPVVRAAFRLADDGVTAPAGTGGLRRAWLTEAGRLLGEAEAAGELSADARGDGAEALLAALLYGMAPPGADRPAGAGPRPEGGGALWQLLLPVLVGPGRAGRYRTAPPRSRAEAVRAA